MLVFAILGMQLFSDSFGACSDPSFTTRDACLAARVEQDRALLTSPPPVPPLSVTDGGFHFGRHLTSLEGHVDEVQGPGFDRRALKGGGDSTDGGGDDGPIAWRNPPFGSFDDFGSAMTLLYVMSTGDGWEEVLFVGMDAVGPGLAPQRNDTNPVALYFILWIFVGSFFAMNLFVGVIVDNFNKICKGAQTPPPRDPHATPRCARTLRTQTSHSCYPRVNFGDTSGQHVRAAQVWIPSRAEEDGSATMTAEQQQWVDSMKVRRLP